MNNSLSLIIPMYNSETTIATQLRQCRNILSQLTARYEIIVSDDHSTDASAQILRSTAKQFPIRCIFHSANQGIAPTLRELYDLTKHDYIIIFSIDGDWDPLDIGRMVRYAYLHQADIVIGQRKKDAYTPYRKIISAMYNLLPRIFFGVDTFDAGSIKVVKNSLYKRIQLSSTSVFFEAELIMKAHKQGARILPYSFVTYVKKVKSSGLGGKPSYVAHALWDLFRLRLTGL